MTARICCFLALLLLGCTVDDREHADVGEVPLILGAKAAPAERWRNACVVSTEQQLRTLESEPVVHEFWYQTPTLDAPTFPPNLTQKGLPTMNRCHIQGTRRLRADNYMVLSANSQDRPRGLGERKWALNNCPSLQASQGGGAHLFVAKLDHYISRPGHAWHDQASLKQGIPTTHQIVKNVLLNVDDNSQLSEEGSLTEFWHPGGIDGVGDFVYVGIDGFDQKSRMKILDMADPANPVIVGGRRFPDHKSQAFGTTDLADGRILLAVVDTYRGERNVHFYMEDIDPVSGQVIRHQFSKAGTWSGSTEAGKGSRTGFPFLKYQSLALLRECGSDEIYMIGIHNDRRLRCGGLIEVSGFKAPTRVDLYRVQTPDEPGPDAVFHLEKILRRNMKDHNGEGCAGATAHVTPEGQVVTYTIEHGGIRQFDSGRYPEGLKRWVGKVRFYEYSTRVALASLVDGDDVIQDEDLCPDEAEDPDGFNDNDGCPDEDNDTDGITDERDRCPDGGEDDDGINDSDGCAESEDNLFRGNRVIISYEKMFSNTDNLTISDAGLYLVTGLVNWWREHGRGDICIQAHTNKYGDVEIEQSETDMWAGIVEQALIGLGVPAQKIKARGYGSRKPVVGPANSEAEHLNVRIEFMQCVL